MKKQWLSIMTMVCVLTVSIPFPSVAYNRDRIGYGESEIATKSDAILDEEEEFDELAEEHELATESDAVPEPEVSKDEGISKGLGNALCHAV